MAEVLIPAHNERVAARFQRLQDVVVIHEMPRNVAGKTLKGTLREDYDQEKLGGA